MSKISYSVLKKLKLERLLKRQNNFDNVIVFDEEFEIKYNHFNNKHYWLTFVDFCTTYKYDPNTSCLKTASYKDIVDKANEWLRHLPQFQRNDRLIPGQPIWTVINCETLYAKISINFNESGEIVRKRVMQFSKWPLNDELFMNIYCDTNTMIQNFEQIFNGRYIVVLLRVWLRKHPYFPLMLIDPPETICIKDYWPQKISIEDPNSNSNSKSLRKSADLKRKLKKTLSIDGGSSGSSSGSNHNHHGGSDHHHHSGGKECLEKLKQINKRINNDIISNVIDGQILNVVTFPCYYHRENIQSETKIDLGKIPGGSIVNLIRVFYLLNQPVYPYDGTEYNFYGDGFQKKLIGIMDFVPRCISSGGFIKYPKFETQTDIIDKATMWMTKHRQYQFLNFNSVDIRLKSMTVIDSGEMTFSRTTGDFVRILRLIYLKPLSNDNEQNLDDDDDQQNLDHPEKQQPQSPQPPPSPKPMTISDVVNWQPTTPIYLKCKNIVSINNSIKELQQQMNDYLWKVRKKNDSLLNNQNQNYGERWKFLCADSCAIFQSNLSGSSSNSSSGGGGSSSGNNSNSNSNGYNSRDDLRNRKNNLLADCDKSFHIISISSTNMNRNMLNGINIFYDVGLFGQKTKLMMTSNLNLDTSNIGTGGGGGDTASTIGSVSANIIHDINNDGNNSSSNNKFFKLKNNRPNSSTTIINDQNNCRIS